MADKFKSAMKKRQSVRYMSNIDSLTGDEYVFLREEVIRQVNVLDLKAIDGFDRIPKIKSERYQRQAENVIEDLQKITRLFHLDFDLSILLTINYHENGKNKKKSFIYCKSKELPFVAIELKADSKGKYYCIPHYLKNNVSNFLDIRTEKELKIYVPKSEMNIKKKKGIQFKTDSSDINPDDIFLQATEKQNPELKQVEKLFKIPEKDDVDRGASKTEYRFQLATKYTFCVVFFLRRIN